MGASGMADAEHSAGQAPEGFRHGDGSDDSSAKRGSERYVGPRTVVLPSAA
jgi:hypothetical protein